VSWALNLNDDGSPSLSLFCQSTPLENHGSEHEPTASVVLSTLGCHKINGQSSGRNGRYEIRTRPFQRTPHSPPSSPLEVPSYLDSSIDASPPSTSEVPPLNHSQNKSTSEPRKTRDDDKFILACRGKGMSYKDIREKGGFTVAESTLRGRFRSLTKHRHERVRKPWWTTADVSSHPIHDPSSPKHSSSSCGTTSNGSLARLGTRARWTRWINSTCVPYRGRIRGVIFTKTGNVQLWCRNVQEEVDRD
jgi:hypothetical protein